LSKDTALDEHLLIQKYFSNIGSAFLAEHNVEVSVGDDASVISSKQNIQQINSLDTSIEGVHFLSSMSSADIAYRSCVIALSDLAACGARPKWYSIAITLPQVEHSWLNSFSIGLQKFSDEYRIPLIGGDTTKGKLSITVQVMGEVDSNKAILRSTAKENQLIFVSGIIGNAYLGLKELSDNTGTDSYSKAYLKPKAHIDLGLKLSDIASSCIDISDGLLQDLNLICQSSNVGAEIYLEKIPTSISEKSLELINSGDDYELCFTVDEDKYEELMNVSKILNIPITLIGKTSLSKDFVLYDVDNQRVELNSGYSHF
jgi:thiamine-monophosphate kinase